MGENFEDEEIKEEGLSFLTIPVIIAGLAILICAFIFLKITMGRLDEAETAAAGAKTDAEAAEGSVLPEMLLTRVNESWYRRLGDEQPSAASYYGRIGLNERSEAVYPALAEALERYSEENAAYMKAIQEANCKYVAAGGPNCEEELVYSPKRADEKVFSFSVRYREDGSAGFREGISGAAFDSQTGKRLAFGDVAVRRQDFCDRAAARLFEAYGEEEFDLDSTRKLSDYLFENILLEDMNDLFTVDPLGVTVYLPAGIAAAEGKGVHMVSVFFSESPKMFAENVRGTSDTYVMLLDKAPYVNFIDVEGDGEPETITVEGLSYEPGDPEEGLYPYAGVALGLNGDANRQYFGCDSFEAAAVKNGTSTYLYVSVSAEGKNELLVYEVTGGKVVFTQKQEDVYFLAEPGDDAEEEWLFSCDSNNIALVSTMNALGSYKGTRSCHVGKNGAPAANTDWYMCEDDRWLTARKELRALALDQTTLEPTGKEIIVPAGAYMTFYRTDNAEYVDFFAGNTTYIRFAYGAAHPQSVNGETAAEVFEGLEY
ncbi:MAG: hypothetical protein IKG62_00905 [Lachnospiraceae bacterium]|nr:hypothetical protein [Lachnospiraceae bacterium]